MSILSKVNSAIQEGGLGYVIERAPHYIRWRVQSTISDNIYRAYNPYGNISRSDMISYCESNNQIWYYGSSERIEISTPLTGTTPKQFQDLVGTHESPESFVCELNNVRLVGDRAIPRLEDGRFVLEEMGTESMLKSRVMNTFHRSFNTREKIQQILAPRSAKISDYDTIINMVPRHGGRHNNFVNYGHWLSEDLPRLRAYDHYYENTGQKPTLLIKNDSPSWLKDTLRLLGFSSEDWVEWNRKEAVVSQLIIPKLSYIHSTGAQFQPSDRRWVSNQMKSRIDMAEENEFPERVFVSRQGQGRRKIINFDQMMDALGEFNFEAVRPEELSIQDQVRLFDQAEVIVGPFGASLVNMIFAEDASLVEIKPPATEHTVYYILANENGLRYDYIYGESAAKGGGGSDKDSDILVNVDELVEVVQNIL